MFERGRREFDLLATSVFRIGELQPALFSHRCDSGV
jgi:hypothetical protein